MASPKTLSPTIVTMSTCNFRIWDLPNEIVNNIARQTLYTGNLALKLTCRRFYNAVKQPVWYLRPATGSRRSGRAPIQDYLSLELLLIEKWSLFEGYLTYTECMKLRHRTRFPKGQLRGRRRFLGGVAKGPVCDHIALTKYLEASWKPDLGDFYCGNWDYIMWHDRMLLGRRCADCKDCEAWRDPGREICKVCGTYQKFGDRRTRPYVPANLDGGRDAQHCRNCAGMMDFDDDVLAESVALRCGEQLPASAPKVDGRGAPLTNSSRFLDARYQGPNVTYSSPNSTPTLHQVEVLCAFRAGSCSSQRRPADQAH